MFLFQWQHGGGGICRFQVRVCGWNISRGQDNWLFTQHISQEFDPNTYNYPVEIQVELDYALSSCRERFGCKPKFELYYYATNTTQLPITSGSGFMNTDNYMQFAVVRPADTIRTFTFTLQPNVTGFYFAIRDNGTCVGISRVRVYHNNCRSFQSGLVIYPDTPAHITSNVSVPIQCVPGSSRISNRDSVTCRSDGTWVSENPACECHLGYEDRETECFNKCMRQSCWTILCIFLKAIVCVFNCNKFLSVLQNVQLANIATLYIGLPLHHHVLYTCT